MLGSTDETRTTYFTCAGCGQMAFRVTNGNHNLYCDRCALVKKREKAAERKRIWRERHKREK